MIDAKVKTTDLQKWLIKKSVMMDAELGDLIMEEGSFLLETVTRITPPTDGTLSPNQSWATQRQMGRNAILVDLSKVYITAASLASQIKEVDPNMAKGFSKAIRKQDIPEAQRILYASAMGSYASPNIGTFDSSYHQIRRNGRGRVKGRFVSQIVTDKSALSQYTKKTLDKVGQLKRGWLMAGNGLKRKIKVPAWIDRAQGGGSGSMLDMTKKKLNPSIKFINNSPHAESSNKAVRFAEFAMKIRAGNVRRTVEAMVKRNWKK